MVLPPFLFVSQSRSSPRRSPNLIGPEEPPSRVRGVSIRAGWGGLSPLVSSAIKVGVVILLVALLYWIVRGIPPEQVEPMSLRVTQEAGNWSLEILGTPGGKLPRSTHLLIRNTTGEIVLSRTPFSNLTASAWAVNGAQYVDGNPEALEVRPGDRLLLDLGRYPAGYTVEVSDEKSLLAIEDLR